MSGKGNMKLKSIDEVPPAIEAPPIAEAVIELRLAKTVDAQLFLPILIRELGQFEFGDFRLQSLQFASLSKDEIDQRSELYHTVSHQLVSSTIQSDFGGALTGKGWVINIAPRAIGLVHVGPYDGWDQMEASFQIIFNSLRSIASGYEITRAAVRYINRYVGETIESRTNVQVMLAEEALDSSDVAVQFSVVDNDCAARCIVVQDSQHNLVVDIDVYTVPLDLVLAEWEPLAVQLRGVHNLEKRIFFSIDKGVAR